MKGLNIKIYKYHTWDEYTVIINESVFMMSRDPHNPDGCNQYCCEKSSLARGTGKTSHLGKSLKWDDIPVEIKIAICYRCFAPDERIYIEQLREK